MRRYAEAPPQGPREAEAFSVRRIALVIIIVTAACPIHSLGQTVAPNGAAGPEPAKQFVKCNGQCANGDSFLDTKITDWLILAAILLQAWIYWRQRIVMGDQWRAISRQADIAEQALIAVERPFVVAEIVDPGLEIRWIEDLNKHVFSGKALELRLMNVGNTPAFLARLEYNISAAPKGGIISPIDPRSVGGRELPAALAVTKDIPFREHTLLNAVLTMEQKDDVANFRASIWICGFVRYDDLLGGHYIMGFAQVYDPIGMRFIARGGHRYNYARKEKDAEIPPPSSRG